MDTLEESGAGHEILAVLLSPSIHLSLKTALVFAEIVEGAVPTPVSRLVRELSTLSSGGIQDLESGHHHLPAV